MSLRKANLVCSVGWKRHSKTEIFQGNGSSNSDIDYSKQLNQIADLVIKKVCRDPQTHSVL